MKLPTSTKPTSGFHICDILELNKEKQHKKHQEHDDEKSKVDEDDEIEMKKENLSCESDENQIEISTKRKHSPSPTSPITRDSQSPRDSSDDIKDSKKLKKHPRHESDDRPSFDASAGHHQLLNDTIHQYPHLFQNHPAMRPWFNSNGEFSTQFEAHLCHSKWISMRSDPVPTHFDDFHALIGRIDMVTMMNVAQFSIR
jgi:hypothetical protein